MLITKLKFYIFTQNEEELNLQSETTQAAHVLENFKTEAMNFNNTMS